MSTDKPFGAAMQNSVHAMAPTDMAKAPSQTGPAPDRATVSRQHIAMDIFNTEVFYIHHLRLLQKLKMAIYDDEDSDLTTEQINTIFSNIHEIHEISRFFLARLQKITETWDQDSCLGGLFIEFSKHFRHY